MSGFASSASAASDRSRLKSGFDVWLLVSAFALIVVGLMSIYSVGSDKGVLKQFYSQLINTFIGVVPFSIFLFVKPSAWQKFVNPLYVINVVALAGVLLKGHGAKGAVRWMSIGGFQFQPSEMAKILTIITLATYFARRQEHVNKTQTCVGSVAHVALPAFLIILQPHLGATTVLIVAWAAITIIGEVPWRNVGITLLLGVCVLLGLLAIPSVRTRLIPPYWLDRIEGIVASGKTVQRADSKSKRQTYQTDQAKMAFSAGGAFGTGFGKGQQKAGGFIPEQHNDFILTVPGEEAGFFGCTLILFTYGFFFYRVWLILIRARDPYHRMLVAGVFAVLGFHMFANMGMVLGLIPVVGLWLPFMSFGGTAMWLCLSCLGLLVNIDRRERALGY